MVSFTALGCFLMLVVSVDATRIGRHGEEQAAVLRQNQTAVTADDSGDCSEYWLVDKVVGDVKFGKCCTTKCNGKSDFVYEGTFFDCKVEEGKVYDKKSSYDYYCKETCSIKAEALVQYPDLSSWIPWRKGKKEKKSKRYVTMNGVTVMRGGGQHGFAARGCTSKSKWR